MQRPDGRNGFCSKESIIVTGLSRINNSCYCSRVTFDCSVFLRALQPEQDAEQILQKLQSFASRDPSWNPWPRDKDSHRLFQSLDRWISDPHCCLLTVRGAHARPLSHLPAPENFACHIIHILRKSTSVPTFWVLSPIEGKGQAKEAVKTLISQILETFSRDSIEELGSNLSLNEEPSEEQLFRLLHNALGLLNKCFLILELKDPSLAERFHHTFLGAIGKPKANFKALIVSYKTILITSRTNATENATMPSIRLRGSKSGWDPCWNRFKAIFE